MPKYHKIDIEQRHIDFANAAEDGALVRLIPVNFLHFPDEPCSTPEVLIQVEITFRDSKVIIRDESNPVALEQFAEKLTDLYENRVAEVSFRADEFGFSLGLFARQGQHLLICRSCDTDYAQALWNQDVDETVRWSAFWGIPRVLLIGFLIERGRLPESIRNLKDAVAEIRDKMARMSR